MSKEPGMQMAKLAAKGVLEKQSVEGKRLLNLSMRIRCSVAEESFVVQLIY
jgi:hypothetical protein